MNEPERDVLALAKAIQRKVAQETNVWIKLSLFEDLISEIEALRRRVKKYSLADIKKRAETREETK